MASSEYAAVWMRSLRPCNSVDPQHEAVLESEWNESECERYYTCAGCKEIGVGGRCRCKNCDLVMHRACVFRRLIPTPHPLFPESLFTFQTNPPRNDEDGEYTRVCNSCARPIRGFAYQSEVLDLFIHPCCMNLSMMMKIRNDGDGEEFHLQRQVLQEKCIWCDIVGTRNGGDGWSYVSGSTSTERRHIHFDCMARLLVENSQSRRPHQPQENHGWGRRVRRTITELLRMVYEDILEDIIAGEIGF